MTLMTTIGYVLERGERPPGDFVDKLPAWCQEKGLPAGRDYTAWLLTAYALHKVERPERLVKETFHHIRAYRHFRSAFAIMTLFCETLDKQKIASPVHISLPSVYWQAWGGGHHYFRPFLISLGRSEFRDAHRGTLGLIVRTLQLVHESTLPLADKIDLFERLAQEGTVQEILAKIGLVEALCYLKKPIPELVDLEKEVIDGLQKTGLVDLTGISDLGEKLHSCLGHAQSLLTYFSSLSSLDIPSLKPVVNRFFRSVLEKTFLVERYTHCSHLERLSSSLLEAWKHASDTEGPLVDTDNWHDLFFCGTEVKNSCLRIDAIPEKAVCLLAYVMDGKIRMLAAKNEKGQLVARSIIKLLWDEKNHRPVILQEKVYPQDSSWGPALYDLAKRRAESLGLVLLRFDGTGPLCEAHSYDCPAPREYEDCLRAITSGCFTVKVPEVL